MQVPPTQRLFVALLLPEQVRASLVRASAPVRGALPDVRWVRADLLHLTLVFLGERPFDQIEAIAETVEVACRKCSPFALGVGQTGCFPSAERPRVLWAGLVGDLEALIALRHAVTTGWAGANLMEADTRFSPHLTLGRLRDGTDGSRRAEAGRRWIALPPPSAAPIPVEEIRLMRSDLGPGGPHYTILRRVALTRDT